jgi:hypothetical protein
MIFHTDNTLSCKFFCSGKKGKADVVLFSGMNKNLVGARSVPFFLFCISSFLKTSTTLYALSCIYNYYSNIYPKFLVFLFICSIMAHGTPREFEISNGKVFFWGGFLEGGYIRLAFAVFPALSLGQWCGSAI